jgi:hypothetical protein
LKLSLSDRALEFRAIDVFNCLRAIACFSQAAPAKPPAYLYRYIVSDIKLLFDGAISKRHLANACHWLNA